MEGVLKYKFGAAVPMFLPTRTVADKFLYRALILLNAYKCAIFQLLSSISYGETKGVPK